MREGALGNRDAPHFKHIFRGSNFYVALYWAEELAARDAAWAPLAKVNLYLQLKTDCLFYLIFGANVQNNQKKAVVKLYNVSFLPLN